MRVFVATKNAGKLAELQAVFADSRLELGTFDSYRDVVEGETSFEDNALLKAQALWAQLRDAGIKAAVLADDSGLEVDALNGRPGVLSARYAGEGATWAQRREALLAEMGNVPDERRTARFVCVIVLILPDGTSHVERGKVEGYITSEERGRHGFGYDPIFVPNGETQSFAEMNEEKKNGISHRRRAADQLLKIVFID